MEKCKNCFYSTACMSFDELHVTGDETPCENFLNKNMVLVLPCPIGTTVYEKYKDCEHCPNYHEVAYSDYISCEEDNNLFDYSNDEELHDKECAKHIKTKPVQFKVNMINRYGKDVFLTENVAFINVSQELTHLAGHRYGSGQAAWQWCGSDGQLHCRYHRQIPGRFPYPYHSGEWSRSAV